MAYSYVTYNATGSTANFTITFGYLSRQHVTVYLDGGALDFGVDYNYQSSTVIHFLTGNPTGQVRIERDTPIDEQYVNYQDGSTLVESDLDDAALQALYVSQELQDQITDLELGVLPQVFGTTDEIAVTESGTPTIYTAAFASRLKYTGAGVTTLTINSHDNNINVLILPGTYADTEQHIGLMSKMTGVATMTTGNFTIPLASWVQTGGGTGANGIEGLNIVVQQNSADDVAFVAGIELSFNNLKRNDALNPVDQNHFGITVDAYGGFSIGPAAIAIRKAAASSTWQRGIYIPSGSITPSTGYAIDYEGNGSSNTHFTVSHAGAVGIGGAVTLVGALNITGNIAFAGDGTIQANSQDILVLSPAFSLTALRAPTSGTVRIQSQAAADILVCDPTNSVTTGVRIVASAGYMQLTGTGVQPSAGPGWYHNGGTVSTFMGGSGGTRWYSSNAGAELMRLTNTGNLTVGSAGDASATRLWLPAGTTSNSSMRIPAGSAPTSPVDGDIWATTADLFVSLNTSASAPVGLAPWTTPSYNAGDFTAGGSQTWTVASGDVTTYAYIIRGKTMTVNWSLVTTTVGGTPDASLRILIPGGKTAAKAMHTTYRAVDNGAAAVGVAIVSAGGTYIDLRKDIAGTGNWSAATNTTEVNGSFTFEIQ